MSQDPNPVPPKPVPPPAQPPANIPPIPTKQEIPKVAAPASKLPEPPRDTSREIFETVVFVVVLVLMLKLFVAEAFVIPTGSMAPTLYGNQVTCTCRDCGYKFPLNATDRSSESKEGTMMPSDYVCDNCGYSSSKHGLTKDQVKEDCGSIWSGDRVLVSKYEYHLWSPQRFQVPVFKYPVEPFAPNQQQAMNYIKRLVGLENETLAIYCGDLYRTTDLKYEGAPQPADELDRWQYQYMYTNHADAIAAFRAGKFEMIRKSPKEILAVRRIVFDLNHQPNSAEGIRRTRWHPSPESGNGWSMEPKGFSHTGDTFGWADYRHVDPWGKETSMQFYKIVDFLGYNSAGSTMFISSPGNCSYGGPQWVHDLLVECDARIGSPDAEVVLDLAQGPNRYQAKFKSGVCRLVHISPGTNEEVELGQRPTKITKAGKYHLRFANFDAKLTVWVDKKALPFDPQESDYTPPSQQSKFTSTDHDLLPARIGASGDVQCSDVRLWRDIHYTCSGRVETYGSIDEGYSAKAASLPLPKPEQMSRCGDSDVQTFYIQPGHYFMLGDNTNSSADSRSWGVVPRRLMLGRAAAVYFPPSRIGMIE